MRAWWLTLALLLVCPKAVSAHPLAPAAVLLREQLPNNFALQLRRPARGTVQLTLTVPSACAQTPAQHRTEADELISESLVRCTGALPGQRLQLNGFGESELSAIVHIQYRNGESVRALLHAGREQLVIPQRRSEAAVLREFLVLGAQHMAAGLDHLLFTAGLLLLGPVRRALLLLTAFTLGHSVTLMSVAILAWSLPSAPVELGIALTLVGLSLTVLQKSDATERPLGSPDWRVPALLTFAVGLLHGLGFAEGLRELMLPQHALLSALFGFNVGLELAQLACVSVLAPLLWLYAKGSPTLLQRTQRVLGYALGAVAAMWCIERTLLLLS